IVLSVGGIALVVGAGAREAQARNPLLGALLMAGSVIAWAAYTVFAKRIAHADPFVVTASTSAIGTVMLIVSALWGLRHHSWPSISTRDWLGMAYLGAFSSAGGFLFYSRALRDLEASEAGVYLNLAPLVGVFSSVLILGEALQPVQILGGAIALFG